MASQADKDTAAAKAKQNNNNQAAKDTAAAQSKTQPRSPHTKLDDSHRDSPNYQGSDAYAREMQESQAGSTSTPGDGPMSGGGQSMSVPGIGFDFGSNRGVNTNFSNDPFYEFVRESQSPFISFDSGNITAGSDMAFKGDPPQVELDPLYGFKVTYDPDNGGIVVIPGSLNSESGIGGSQGGSPTQLWLKATINSDGEVTGGTVTTSNGSGDSATAAYAMIASITWANNAPTIVQNMRGGQSVASCGGSHQWTSHY